MKFTIFKSGQSLVELLIAIGLTSILLPALLTAFVATREGRAQTQQRTEATVLLKEAEEAIRSVRETDWQQISTNGTYHPAISATNWTLVTLSETINGYTRTISIQDTKRDSAGNIAAAGTTDPSTKKIITTVSWTTPINSQVDSTAYFSRYQSNTNIQETTQAQFTAGTLTNTQVTNNGGGEVQLTQSTSTSDYGNKFQVTATSSIGSMTSATIKTSLRFTAQSTKTISAIRVFLQTENGTSPSYTYGIQADDGSANHRPTGTYLRSGVLTATTTGWKTIALTPTLNITAGTIYHLVVQPSGAPTTTNFIAIRRSAPANALYPLTNTPDIQANTLFFNGTSWATQNFQPIYELDFADATFEGNPYETSTAVSVFGVNWIGEKFTVAGGNKTATNISFFVSQNSATEPLDSLQVELRDSNNLSLASGTLATAAQTNTTFTYFTFTFSAPITLTNGSTYRIFLKSPLSNATNFYRVFRVTTTSAANFNSVTYDGTNSVYTLSANSGSTWTDTNVNWDIGGYFFSVSTTSGFAASGTFESQTKDAGALVAFNNLKWVSTTPAGASLQLQVAISPVSTGPWTYFGSDGAVGSFFTSQGPIPLNRINGQFVRYKATLTSTGPSTPVLNEVNLNYSP